MDAYFVEMLRRLRLTKPQQKDAETKYTRVAKILHTEFYDTEYTGSTKLLIGSYGKKTNIRPPGDVDLLFKIPAEVLAQYQDYEGNGAAALLQRVRTVLGKTYTTTDKISAWGKVVLVKFADGTHDIELLPGYEADGVFIIPNSEDGGSWESFDARSDLGLVSSSHHRTGGKTRRLIRIAKRWRKSNATMTIKAYEIEQYCVQFLDQTSFDDKSWSELVADFFAWLPGAADKDVTFIETARGRAARAREYEAADKIEAACNEWRKVFGAAFPVYSSALNKVYALSQQYPSDAEQFIEDMYPVRLNPSYTVAISSTVSRQGFITRTIGEFLRKYAGIPKGMSLGFEATTNVPGPAEFCWKVRNFGIEAKNAAAGKGLRGEITNTGTKGSKRETTLYKGTHYVECYIIKDGVCVAKTMQFVPISQETADE